MSAAIARYRRALRAPYVVALVASSVLARLPLGVLALALVLFLREHTGSYAAAGAIAGVYAVSDALSSPLWGRLVDRIGQTRVIVPIAIVNALALTGIVVLGLADAPLVAVGACAAVTGASIPPIGAALRPLWPGLMGGEELLSAGYALDALLTEVVFIAGPALTALLVALFSTAAAVIACAGLVLVGSLWFASLEPSRGWVATGEPTGAWGALATPGIRTLMIGTLPFGFSIGVLEVVLPAFGAQHGSESLPPVLLALQAVGSGIAGLWYGSSERRFGGIVPAYLLMLAIVPVAFGVLAAASSIPVMLALIVLSGGVIAPLTIAENHVLQSVAPAASITEAFTWVLMAAVVGIAAGSAAGGAIVDASGWRLATLVAAGTTALGALVTFTRRRTLAPG